MTIEKPQDSAAPMCAASALSAGLAIFRYEDDDLFSLDDEKYAAAVYRRIDAEYTDEYNQSQMAEIVRQDNERRNAMARLDMILDETNWRFRCAENEAAKAIAKMTANAEVSGEQQRSCCDSA